MDPVLLGIIGLVIMLLLIFLGIPNALSFFTVGFFGIVLMTNWRAALTMIEATPFAVTSVFDWSVIPLFVLMGIILYETHIGEDIFLSVGKWLGHIAGGMAAAVSAACALIGTMTGSGFATSALMAKMAYPEMRKVNYQPDLSLAVCAASSTVAMMIPPSIIIVVYGILAEQSIGKCLLAGFIPGFMSMGIYMVMIFIRCRLNPSLGPPLPSVSWQQRLVSLRYLIPVVVMVITIVGGLFFGVFTATEAGGMGALFAFIVALTMRRFTWTRLKNVLSETARLTVMIMVILVCIRFLIKFLNLAGLTTAFAKLALGLPSPWLTFCMMFAVIFVIGMFLSSTLMYVTVPMFTPVIIALGFDPIWFGILLIKMQELGSISPPVCMTLFIAQGIVGEVSMERAYKSVLWFMVCDVFTLILLVIFPQISLFLPRAARMGIRT